MRRSKLTWLSAVLCVGALSGACLSLSVWAVQEPAPPVSTERASNAPAADESVPDRTPEKAVPEKSAPEEPVPEVTATDADAAARQGAATEEGGSGDEADEKQPTNEAAEDPATRRARIQELLSLVSDNTEYIKPRENPAYYALIKELMQQPPEQLRSQAIENPRFNEFHKDPAKYRGQVVHLTVNLRRVLPVEIEHENEAGVTKLYELWGWTDEAKAWMYCCVTPELPPGLPTKGDVAERVEITGYFFKMQAYQPGDAAPNARNLVAPLIIGRVTPAPKPPNPVDGGLGNWPLILIVGFGIIIAFRLVMQVRTFGRPIPTHRNYRRRSLEPLDADSLSDSLADHDRGLRIRNADEEAQ